MNFNTAVVTGIGVAGLCQIKQTRSEGVQGELLEAQPEYDYFCYVTTEPLTPWETHKTYGKRATCETWIEENKTRRHLGRLKRIISWRNSALMQCAILAYNTTTLDGPDER